MMLTESSLKYWNACEFNGLIFKSLNIPGNKTVREFQNENIRCRRCKRGICCEFSVDLQNRMSLRFMSCPKARLAIETNSFACSERESRVVPKAHLAIVSSVKWPKNLQHYDVRISIICNSWFRSILTVSYQYFRSSPLPSQGALSLSLRSLQLEQSSVHQCICVGTTLRTSFAHVTNPLQLSSGEGGADCGSNPAPTFYRSSDHHVVQHRVVKCYPLRGFIAT